jgi:hypothetical protein
MTYTKPVAFLVTNYKIRFESIRRFTDQEVKEYRSWAEQAKIPIKFLPKNSAISLKPNNLYDDLLSLIQRTQSVLPLELPCHITLLGKVNKFSFDFTNIDVKESFLKAFTKYQVEKITNAERNKI